LINRPLGYLPIKVGALLYSELVEVYDKIGATTKRLEITDILVSFFKRCPPDLIGRAVYLTQGRLYPEFEPLELGVAGRLIMKCISQATATPESEVDRLYKTLGDLGNVAEALLSKGKRQSTLDSFASSAASSKLTIEFVYSSLDAVARSQGEGSQEKKLRLLADLLRDSSPREALYVIRTVSGALRLGVADMTILDALAIACCGSKSAREAIERAYNVTSDLGSVATMLTAEGVDALQKLRPTPGRPIRPMLAERLSTADEILEKMGGRCAIEYKYDGERAQIHFGEGDAFPHLFSRRLENIDHHYPDVSDIVNAAVNSKSYIIEGEIVAIDPSTSELLPFQELMHRRRKYDVEKMALAYPASVRLFDALVMDGEDLTSLPYGERRSRLAKVVTEGPLLRLAEQSIVSDAPSLERFFEDAISNGCEGIIAKSLGPESTYNAGARGWLWIKYKRDYKSEMHDTVDLAVVGALMGTGKRAGYLSSLLLAAYCEAEDTFKTVCKCSTGFTDEDLKGMKARFDKYVIPHRHARVDSKLVPDVWLLPSQVIEVLGAEITLSPIHTCGTDAIRKGSGLAIRFPRFTGNWRNDKGAEDATTEAEIVEMYKKQLKKISD